jgi:hypothetical protein
MHIQAPDNRGTYESALTQPQLDNYVLDVTSMLIQGSSVNDALAVVYRIPQDHNASGYFFLVYSNGTYILTKTDLKGNTSILIDRLPSTNIHRGLNVKNEIKLSIINAQFKLYLNGQQINQDTDKTFTSGYIALGAYGQGTEAVFSNLTITKP